MKPDPLCSDIYSSVPKEVLDAYGASEMRKTKSREDRHRVYLAGPIFQQTDATCNDWRAKFKECEQFYWMDPMARDFRGKEDKKFREIVEGDKADVDACHALVAKVNPPSAGTSMEILWAWLNRTPVIAITEGRVSPWVRYHAHDIVASEEAALQKLKELFA